MNEHIEEALEQLAEAIDTFFMDPDSLDSRGGWGASVTLGIAEAEAGGEALNAEGVRNLNKIRTLLGASDDIPVDKIRRLEPEQLREFKSAVIGLRDACQPREG